MAENFDAIMSSLGTGKWNLLYFFSMGYWYFFSASYVLGSSFMGAKVDFSCRRSLEHQQQQTAHSNASDSECAYSVISIDGHQQEQLCQEWDFDNSTFTNTVFSEYKLVCDRHYLHAIYMSIFMIGSLMGAPLNALSDKYGRKSVLVVATLIHCLAGIVTPFLPNITAVLIARFIIGTMYVIHGTTGYNLVMEVCAPAQRSTVGVVIWLSYVVGVMAWGVLGYAVRDWRMLHLTIAVPTFFFLIMLWAMDESPRWLAVVGRHKECKRVLRKAARWNNAELPDEKDMDNILDNTVRDKHDPVYNSVSSLYKSQSMGHRAGWRAAWDGCMDVVNTFLSLFSTAKLRLRTSVTWLNFFLVGTVFWGLSMSGVSFSNDPFLYMILTGLMEAPGYSVWAMVLHRLGRKGPTVVCFIISGVALLALHFVPQEIAWLRMVLALVGKLSISCAWAGLGLHALELFPTELRSLAFGLCVMSSRVGGIIAPMVSNILGTYFPWAPSMIFGGGAVIAGLAEMLLPETLGRDLPDTVHDL